MPLKMILDHAQEAERPIVSALLRHIIVGFGSGFVLGAIGYALILFSMRDQSIDTPLLFGLLACIFPAAIGGLIATGVFMSRITERDGPNGHRPNHHHSRNDQMLDPAKDRPAEPR
ncbi:MAG: hypothetical protein AAFY34_02320 [Pseudomonadota bacterium]